MAKKNKNRNLIIISLVIVGAIFIYFIFGKTSGNVGFRTTDLGYGIGSSVAYNFAKSCGGELKALGFDPAWSGELWDTCINSYGRMFFPVPCSWGVDDCKAYINFAKNTNTYIIDICSDKANKVSEYSSSIASNMQTSSSSINSNLEVTC